MIMEMITVEKTGLLKEDKVKYMIHTPSLIIVQTTVLKGKRRRERKKREGE